MSAPIATAEQSINIQGQKMNTIFEVIGYWAGNIPRWIPIGGTFVFGSIAIICLLHILA